MGPVPTRVRGLGYIVDGTVVPPATTGNAFDDADPTSQTLRGGAGEVVGVVTVLAKAAYREHFMTLY